ncbi:glycosyltransferase [uncultured Victivallis sp.]|uniref:glycosyltransferase n=1 Tax=uncultured Victivallis sp. TaxID=354118 RepID=UPI002595F17D|nr:glycosyltransferase [uncultured Victivallis sp.]
MRVIELVASIRSEYGGPAYTVPALASALRRAGVEVELHTLAAPEKIDCGVPVTVHPLIRGIPAFAGYSAGLYGQLQMLSRDSDIIHSHLLWTALNILPEFARRGRNCRHVISPRGTLSRTAMGMKSWRKAASLRLGQWSALEHADLFHATSDMEYEDIRRMGLRQPVAVLPNGIELPQFSEAKRRPACRTLLYFGRYHPIKGIEMLLSAWKKLSLRHPEWRLRLVGPCNAYAEELKKAAEKCRLPRVEFCGELKGARKIEAYREASLFVLPSFSENFGVTVAEALACGTPAVTTTGTPWKQLEEHGCGRCVPAGEEPLTGALDWLMSCGDDELAAMGERGRSWMEEFNWTHIGERMKTIYGWLCCGGDRPDEVRPD